LHWVRRIDSRTELTAGNNKLIKMPRMAMTTSNSTSVNAPFLPRATTKTFASAKKAGYH